MNFSVSGNPDKYNFVKLPAANPESSVGKEFVVPEDYSLLFETNNNVFGTFGRTNPINSAPALQEPVSQNTDRLNDLDTNLIKKNVHTKIEDNTLKLEEQINNTMEELSIINSKIDLLNLLNLEYDKKRIQEYKDKKAVLEAKLRGYRTSYRELGIVCNASDVMSEAFQTAGKKIEKSKADVKNNFMISFAAKIIPGLNKNIALRHSINDLKMINKSVAEIMQQKSSPKGEEDSQRASLIAFLSKANLIEASISKALGE